MQKMEALNCPPLIGESPEMNAVRTLVGQVAESDATVLILGESGTGKEVVARNIHARSSRKDGPFIPINCGAIPEDLLESELFGHERGAFTGAVTARPGRFELAKGGTLFLDEIGDMPLHMQVKLLRVLQERVFSRVGSGEIIEADVRIIAATHQDLESRVSDGSFRMDLFYRLNVFPIEIAPLRERARDIGLLVDEIMGRQGLPAFELSDEAMASLMNHEWPGNVRELGNLVERLSILYAGRTVRVADLPAKYVCQGDGGVPVPLLGRSGEPLIPERGIDLKEQLQNIEISMIKEALDISDWVVARSAKLLGLQRTTLVEKMRKYSIDRYAPAS